MRVFFDSSALAKRYIRERGSDKVENILSQASEAAISLIAPPEIISALNRLLRQSLISSSQYKQAKDFLFSDIADISICSINVPSVHKAIGLIEAHPLRTLDALHVASAIEWKADLFVTSDKRQLGAAIHSGLHAEYLGHLTV